MSLMKVCERCGKGARTAISRSHSMIATKRRQRPNLQRVRVGNRRLLLCTSCIGVVTRTITPAPKVPAAATVEPQT